VKNLDCYFFKFYIYTHAAKNRRFSFLLLSRSVHFLFRSKLILNLFNLLFFLFLFWTVCQIDCGFLFGHRDRSETHPAYLPTFSVKLSFMRISIYSLYTYYIFFSFYSMYNEWLASMYVCMLFYSRCGKIYI